MAGHRQLVAQFLEGGPQRGSLAPDDAVAVLSHAFAHLPITHLCVGWQLDDALLRAVTSFVRAETTAELWLWQPLLSGNGIEPIADEDLTVGPGGEAIRGPAGDAFTFICPKRPEAFARALERLVVELSRTRFDGVMLDRIRWPSPAVAPGRLLACFCDDCADAAAIDGLDLTRVADEIEARSADLDGRRGLVRALLGASGWSLVHRFLRWRESVIGDSVDRASEAVGTRVALDVFSPAIAPMVGQDIRRLSEAAGWTKAMIYSTVDAPAGLPFELGGLAHWLADAGDDDPGRVIGDTVGFAVPPPNLERSDDLGIDAVRVELAALVRAAGPLGVAGIEAVELPGVVGMTEAGLSERLRMAADMQVPIALSWDLALTPPTWIQAIVQIQNGRDMRGA